MKRITLLLILITSLTRAYSQCNYDVVWTGNGLDQMNIYIMNATIDGNNLQAGDKVAVFDGPYCVGLATVSGSGMLAITASKDDAVTPGVVDGYREGNAISFRICDLSAAAEVPNISVSVTSGSLFFEPSGSVFVNLAATTCQGPSKPLAISGRRDICKNETVTYSIEPVAGATSYTWSLPEGWTGSSNTTTITAKAGSGGTISVTAVNGCGTGEASTFEVKVHAVPAQPGLIKGNTEMCEGSAQSYCIETIEGATAYTWSFPTDWTGNSLYNSVSVTAGKQSGNVSVSATNFCGASPARTIEVEVTQLPCNAGAITGNTIVCEGVTQTYSIGAVNGANSYAWTLPEGWTGTSTSNSITVTPGNNGGTITVKADNECGSGAPQSMAVNVGTIPAQPAAIEGEEEICEGLTVEFSVPEVQGATSYTWTLPAGWTGLSSSETISTVALSSGTITVKANGICGSSAEISKDISVLNLITAPVIDTVIQPDCQVSTGSAMLSGLPVDGTWMITINELSTGVESKPVLTSLRYSTGTIITGTGTSKEITGLAPGKYSFTVYSETGCTSAESESIVIGMAPVVPTAPLIGEIIHPTCQYALGSIKLTGLPPAGTWILQSHATAETLTGSGVEIIIDSLPSGSYDFRVSNDAGCQSDYSDDATIDPQPQVPAAPVVSFTDNVLHSNAAQGNQWYNLTGAIAGETGQDYTPTAAGSYWVVVTLGECSSPVSNTINYTITGIDVRTIESLQIYPNPVDDEMVVELKNVTKILHYEILDLTGKVVLNGEIQGPSVVKTGMLANGVYMFRVNVDGEVVTRKIVKK